VPRDAKNRCWTFLSIDQMPSDQEIEEGEIIEDDDIVEDLDDEEEDFNFEESGIDLVDILTTPEGDTVCSALVALVQQIQTQNKILIKMLGKMG
jgi:hypothetical protein